MPHVRILVETIKTQFLGFFLGDLILVREKKIDLGSWFVFFSIIIN